MFQLSLKKSLVWMGGASLFGQIVTWGITIIVARLLTPEDYGLIALSGIFTVFATSISEMGVGAAVIQSDNISIPQVRALYSLSILMGAIMTLFGAVIAPAIAYIFDEHRLVALVRFQSLVFIFSALKSMQRTILVRETRFDVIAKVETSARILTSFCTLLLAYIGFGVWALAAQWLFIELYQFIGFSFQSRILPSLSFSRNGIKPVLRFGVGIMSRNVIFKLYNMTDVAILGKFAAREFLGGYSFAKQLTNIPFEKILTLVNNVLFPYLSHNKNNMGLVREWSLKIAEFETFLLFPFFIALFFCANETVYILLGRDWSVAAFPMRIFCIASLFKLADNYNKTVLTAMGYVRVQIRFLILQLFAVSGGMSIICYLWGTKVSIYVWITFYPAITLMLCHFMIRKIGIEYVVILKRLSAILISNTMLVLTLYSLDQTFITGAAWQRLVVKLSVGAIVYIGVLLIVDRGKIHKLLSTLRT